MTYQTPSTQQPIKGRRVLMTLSLGLLIYFLGGGSLDDHAVTFPLVGINLEHEQPLLLIAIVAFLLAILRYLQFNLKTALDSVAVAARQIVPAPALDRFASKQQLQKHGQYYNEDFARLDFVEVYDLFRDDHSYYVDLIPPGEKERHKNGAVPSECIYRVHLPRRNRLVIYANAKAALLLPDFGDYLGPLLLASLTLGVLVDEGLNYLNGVF